MSDKAEALNKTNISDTLTLKEGRDNTPNRIIPAKTKMVDAISIGNNNQFLKETVEVNVYPGSSQLWFKGDINPVLGRIPEVFCIYLGR